MDKTCHSVRYPHKEKRNMLGLVSKAWPPTEDVLANAKKFQPKVVLQRLRLKQLGLTKGNTTITYKSPCKHCKISMCACRWYAALKRKREKLISEQIKRQPLLPNKTPAKFYPFQRYLNTSKDNPSPTFLKTVLPKRSMCWFPPETKLSDKNSDKIATDAVPSNTSSTRVE